MTNNHLTERERDWATVIEYKIWLPGSILGPPKIIDHQLKRLVDPTVWFTFCHGDKGTKPMALARVLVSSRDKKKNKNER